jgi:hypothetical protein
VTRPTRTAVDAWNAYVREQERINAVYLASKAARAARNAAEAKSDDIAYVAECDAATAAYRNALIAINEPARPKNIEGFMDSVEACLGENAAAKGRTLIEDIALHAYVAGAAWHGLRGMVDYDNAKAYARKIFAPAPASEDSE